MLPRPGRTEGEREGGSDMKEEEAKGEERRDEGERGIWSGKRKKNEMEMEIQSFFGSGPVP